jgi:hypothetical protein
MSAVSNCLFVRNGQFDGEEGSNAAQLAQIFAAYKASGRTKLVLYFHGGLVDKTSAMQAAALLTPAYEAANAFPVFIIWETGWAEVIDQNLPKIFGEGIFQRLVARVSQFVKGKLSKASEAGATKDAGDLPLDKLQDIENELKASAVDGSLFSELDFAALQPSDELTDTEAAQIRAQIEKDLRLQQHVEEISNGRDEDPSTGTATRAATGTESTTTTLMDSEIVDEIAPSQEGKKGLISMVMLGKHVVAITASVIKRLSHKRDHGVYLTVVEEIMRELYVRAAGKFFWDHMKQSVEGAFDAGDATVGRALIKELQAADLVADLVEAWRQCRLDLAVVDESNERLKHVRQRFRELQLSGIATPDLIQTLRKEFPNPMHGIHSGHLLLKTPDYDVALLRDVTEILRLQVGDHPDVMALLAADPNAAVTFRTPPMMRSSWQLIVRSTAARHDLVPPDSYAAAIGNRLWGSGAWLVWRQPEAALPVEDAQLPDAPVGLLLVYVQMQLHSRTADQFLGELAQSKRFTTMELTVLSYVARLMSQLDAARAFTASADQQVWYGSVLHTFASWPPKRSRRRSRRRRGRRSTRP